MNIFPPSDQHLLLSFLPTIQDSQQDWVMLEMSIDGDLLDSLTPRMVANKIAELYVTFEGNIYICGESDLMVLIHWKSARHAEKIPANIVHSFPKGLCESDTKISSSNYLFQAQMSLHIPHIAKTGSPHYRERMDRVENIFLVADDDMYMRDLVSHGIGSSGMVIEIGTGSAIVNAYTKHNPDVVFLDGHLPGLNGMEAISAILAVDPQAYIVMISSDASVNVVEQALQRGAKGFLAKPFTKEKLLEFVQNCPSTYFV